jgi:uncharacterized protein YodC (DUF2158 family)
MSKTCRTANVGRKAIETEIKGGSVVKLKSGGPKMTVEAVFFDGSRICVRCSWIDDTKRISQAFELDTLEPA